MLVLLPPSETKAAGGDGPPLRLDDLSSPELTPTRRKLVDELVRLAADEPTGLATLGLTDRQVEQLRRNGTLLTAPTMPSLERYTGVLYEALDIASLDAAERARADSRLAIASALFGVLDAHDLVPAYRLSGGASLPGLGTLRAVWRPVLPSVLAEMDPVVVDLRSSSYAALAPLPGAISVRVLCEDRKGVRTVVSHFNKAHKGRLARLLALAPGEVTTVDDVARIAADTREAGTRVERAGERALELIVPA